MKQTPAVETCARLAAVSDQIEALFADACRDLSFKQWRVLVAAAQLAYPTLTMISETLGTSRQNIKKSVVILMQKGYVSLIDIPHDRRAKCVQLERKGYQYFRDFEVLINVRAQSLLAPISDADLSTLNQILIYLLGI